MPRSLANGDYSLLIAIESASRPDNWYRVLADRQSGALSCDCPPFIFNRQHDEQGRRRCMHTEVATRLLGATPTDTTVMGSVLQPESANQLLVAIQEQWPGLRGTWSVEQRLAPINTHPYLFVLLRLVLGNGGTATGVVAFAERHQPTLTRMQAGVAGWAGYAIAAEVARLGGYPMAGQPPQHFRIDRRPATGRAARRAAGSASTLTPSHIGLSDILRVGDQVDLGDGLVPAQRAENTLRLFLGEQCYNQLESQHFLDVSSVCYASVQRVYRLRRDPAKMRERRVRVFEHGRYVHDFCIVRGQHVPEADHYLTVFLGLLSDEMAALSVVRSSNIFPPMSDGQERETVSAIWQPRAMPVMA